MCVCVWGTILSRRTCGFFIVKAIPTMKQEAVDSPSPRTESKYILRIVLHSMISKNVVGSVTMKEGKVNLNFST